MDKGKYHFKSIKMSPKARQLLDKGVSRAALRTTLELENPDLREVITDFLVVQESGETQYVYFYPEPDSNTRKFLNNTQQCDLVYNLFLKENYLHGNAVYEYGIDQLLGMADVDKGYIPLPENIRLESTASRENSKLVMQFIPDFYNSTTQNETIFDHKASSRVVETYMRYAHNTFNNCFVLQGTAHPEYLLGTWSPFLVSTLVNSARIVKISTEE